jgi:hypothetical protein
MLVCEENDFMYPMRADIYYPIITQNDYGQANKEWVFDRTIVCNATPVGGNRTEDIRPEVFLQYENKLIARSKSDIRTSSTNTLNAATNILITNIRDIHDNLIYTESAGPRAGRGTIYELGTFDPFSGPFGDVEFFKMLRRRTENQSVGD